MDAHDKLLLLYPTITLPSNVIHMYRKSGVFPDVHLMHGRILATTIPLAKVLSLWENLYDNTLACTVLSYFMRAEQTYKPDEFLATLEEQKIKEYNASSALDQPQRLDYRILFGIEAVGIHSEVNELPVRTAQLFQYRLRELLSRVEERVVLT
jgi:hypothetical protein